MTKLLVILVIEKCKLTKNMFLYYCSLFPKIMVTVSLWSRSQLPAYFGSCEYIKETMFL